MILRYGIELDHTATFTASIKVKDQNHAEQKVKMLKEMNVKAGYTKYFNAILYTDENIELRKFQI